MAICLVCLEQKDKLHDAFTCRRCNDKILVTNFLRRKGTKVSFVSPAKEGVNL